jgi:hypothetical protein
MSWELNWHDVDSWEILLRCPKCGIENEVNLRQIKRGRLFNAMFALQKALYKTKMEMLRKKQNNFKML